MKIFLLLLAVLVVGGLIGLWQLFNGLTEEPEDDPGMFI